MDHLHAVLSAAAAGGVLVCPSHHRHLAQRRQIVLHIGLITAALLLLPITPDAGYKPAGDDDPVRRILFILTTSVGVSFFLIATTGPLLQVWFRLLFAGTSPYRLYALSNLGSLLALLSYPFIVEPSLRLQTQSGWWSAGMVAFGVLCSAARFKPERSVFNPSEGCFLGIRCSRRNAPSRPGGCTAVAGPGGLRLADAAGGDQSDLLRYCGCAVFMDSAAIALPADLYPLFPK
jgi:hypothetical protein